MNTKQPILLLAFLFLIGLYGCDQLTTAITDSGVEYEKKLFVWSGLNIWYFWQDRVPALADKNMESTRNFNAFLNFFQDEKELFDNLKFQKDEFSWFIDDYEVHEAARLGSSKSFGFRFGLLRLRNSDDVFGYVQYVVRNTPAEKAGLKRGDIFNKVNGEKLTINNYQELLATDYYRLELAELTTTQQGLRATDKVVEVTAQVIREDPVHTSGIYDIGTNTIGYLLYNAFRFNFHRELNEQFREFRNFEVNELVLDLRYNSGGALITSTLLASLVSGIGQNEDVTFAELIYSDKKFDLNNIYRFLKNLIVYDESGELIEQNGELHSLNLRRVYVLTSSRTASASETIINGLRAHGVEVIIIGEKTRGKDEGSITLYDAPPSYTMQSRSNLNPNHKRAMQPIIFKIFNANGENYPDGFMPDIDISETSYLLNLPALGDPNEPLLNAAITHITGSLMALRTEDSISEVRRITDSSELKNQFDDEFYLIPSNFEKLTGN